MEAGRHEAEGPPDGEGFDAATYAARPKRVRKHRRVSTDPVPGSDPNPQPEPSRYSGEENDDRLKADKPPHWG